MNLSQFSPPSEYLRIENGLVEVWPGRLRYEVWIDFVKSDGTYSSVWVGRSYVAALCEAKRWELQGHLFIDETTRWC